MATTIPTTGADTALVQRSGFSWKRLRKQLPNYLFILPHFALFTILFGLAHLSWYSN